MKRRTLLQSAAMAAAPLFIPSRVLGRGPGPAPSNRITIGIIGCGNMGTGDLQTYLRDDRVQVVAVCDVNKQSAGYWDNAFAGREPARMTAEWTYGVDKRSGVYKGCTAYEDFRDLLARKDIDAVSTAVPDHWHAIAAIEAAKSGKDIYGQKPLALTIGQGRAIADAVKKYNRVFQCGSQQRSDAKFRKACELVRNGRIGKVHTVRCGLPGGTPDFSKAAHRKAPEPVPEGFNYDFWLGPAPEAPYAPARCHCNFRWILDYSGGQITDWGGHHPDIAQWGLGMDESGPVEIKNAKGEWAKDPLYNTATQFYYEAIYENGVKLIVSNKERGGVTFEGSDGWVWVTRGAIDANPKSLLSVELGPDDIHLYKSDDHHRNFIDCVMSRKQPIAPAETAHRSITIAHLGNIALRLGRDLKWDPKTERFADDASADAMISRPMRAPWKIEI